MATDDDDIEAEALILHRLSTDDRGRQTVTTVSSEDYKQPRVTDAYDDLDSDDGRMPKLPPRGTLEGSNTATNLDKTGRPAWFRNLLEGDIGGRDVGLSASTASKRRRARARYVRLGALLALLLLIILAFSYAFGPRMGKIYEYAGDKWYGDNGVMPYDFNKDVGFPGPFQTGQPANHAEEMTATATKTLGASPIQTDLPGFNATFQPFEHLGPYTPYISSSGFGVDDAKYGGTPRSSSGETCKLTQVNMLHRHGARYPTTGAPPTVLQDHLRANPDLKYTGALSFLNSYVYRVGTELLTPVGRQQLYDSGAKAAIMYGSLVHSDSLALSPSGQPKKLFGRAGSQQRIVDSGKAWFAGFFGDNWRTNTSFEIQIEAPGYNTTTAPEFACARPDDGHGSPDAAKWVDIYLADATRRLQPFFGGAQLTPKLVYAMQQLCPYDTVAFGHSDFCALFSKAEWEGFEYSMDLRFQGSYGATSPQGKAMGLGWLNELLSRLTGQPWDPSTQTSENSTLNLDQRTFPLDRSFYVDFTHDSTITAVLAALELPDFADDLRPDRMDAKRGFITSKIVPFAARMVVEAWECEQRYVRIKLNDAVVPLSQPSCDQREDGMCSASEFVRMLKSKNAHGWWQTCRK